MRLFHREQFHYLECFIFGKADLNSIPATHLVSLHREGRYFNLLNIGHKSMQIPLEMNKHITV